MESWVFRYPRDRVDKLDITSHMQQDNTPTSYKTAEQKQNSEEIWFNN